MRNGLRMIFIGMFALGWATGCKRDEVTVYQVANEPPPVAAHGDLNSALPPANAQPRLQFVLPAGWTEQAPSQMRAASFVVTGTNGDTADVGVIPLPSGGNDLALVNMWREQMQLPALTNPPPVETVPVADGSAKWFDLVSEQPLIDGKSRARILVAELPRGATTWFFKIVGSEAFVTAQKDNFLQFLKSVSFADAAPAPAMTAMTAQSPAVDSIWTVPAGWQSVPPSDFLVAKFVVQEGDAKAEVNVSQLAGTGGGLAANINRWRGQVGLPPTEELLSTPIDIKGGTAQLVDFSGKDTQTGKPTRLVGVVAPQGDRTWFYKLKGDETVVAKQKDAFIKFIQSARYPDAR